jgi:hypothetical protein
MEFYPIDLDVENDYKLSYGEDSVTVAETDYFLEVERGYLYSMYNPNYFHIIVLF